MKTNNGDKRILFVGLFIFTLAYLIYDYYTNPCSIYNDFFLVKHKIIDKKYVYYYGNGKLECAYHISNCNDIKYLDIYYRKKMIPKNYDIKNINYMKTDGIRREILKYDYKDSIAYIKFYNTSPRMVKEVYTIVSMKCLHDTLPTGYKEYFP